MSVAEIAKEAEVSEATVFNYFPTKEDLVYQGMEVFEVQMLDAVRQRPASESVLGGGSGVSPPSQAAFSPPRTTSRQKPSSRPPASLVPAKPSSLGSDRSWRATRTLSQP